MPGSSGLNAPEKAFGDQHAEGVVYRLKRDGSYLGPDGLGHGVGRDVGLTRNRPQDSQSLGRHLDTALPKEVSGVGDHEQTIYQIMDSLQYLTATPYVHEYDPIGAVYPLSGTAHLDVCGGRSGRSTT